MTTTNTAPAGPSFDLYVPAVGVGKTHLYAAGQTGILCGNYRFRYQTFTVMGIIPAGSATCDECNRVAHELSA